MITGHVWRPPQNPAGHRTSRLDRPCEFMNCRRPRSEHQRSVSGRMIPTSKRASR